MSVADRLRKAQKNAKEKEEEQRRKELERKVPKEIPPPPKPKEEQRRAKWYGMRLPNYEDVIFWIQKHPEYPISQKTLRKDPRAWAGLGSTILSIAEKIINEEG